VGLLVLGYSDDVGARRVGHMHRLRGILPLLVVVIAPLAWLVAPLPAAACSLDGIASLSLDGILAARTTDTPTAATLANWAPFTFGLAYAPSMALRFDEDRSKVARTLPAAALVTPFRWNFGDAGDTAGRVGKGKSTTRGFAVTHRYARPGWYKIAVQGYWPSRGWVLFDNARVHILPPGQIGQANLGYQIVLGLAFLTKCVAYGGFALFFVIPIALRRRQRARQAGS